MLARRDGDGKASGAKRKEKDLPKATYIGISIRIEANLKTAHKNMSEVCGL